MAVKSNVCLILLIFALQCNAYSQDVKVKFARCYLAYNYSIAEIRALTAAMDERGESALTDYFKCYFTCWLDVPRNGVPVMNEAGVVFVPRNTENREIAEECINNLPLFTNMCDKAYEVQKCLLRAQFADSDS